MLRYFCGPQISEEDFWTYVGQKFSRLPEKSAEAAASVLRNLIDERALSPGSRRLALQAMSSVMQRSWRLRLFSLTR